MDRSEQPVGLDDSTQLSEEALVDDGPPASHRPTRGRARSSRGPDLPPVARNEVVLVGRVPAEPKERELPSGDVLLSWRMVVDRPPPRRGDAAAARRPTVDTLECVAFTAGARRTASGFGVGDVVTVSGALRRRFWRAGGAVASRYDIEVSSARRLWRPRAG